MTIDCLRCGQNSITTLSRVVCDSCRRDTKEFARETEEHRKEFNLGLDKTDEGC